MDNKVNKIKLILSELDNCLDALTYEYRRCSGNYDDDDYQLLKNSIVELSGVFRTLFSIINHD